MFKWVAVLMIVLTGICLFAMGVGSDSLEKLFFALALMAVVSGLIAWPFLRNQPRRE
jgi:hypothetical protein